jgi:hypothetical protein
MSDSPVSAKKKTFSYSEAVALLPELRRLTDEAYRQVDELRPRADGGAADARGTIEEIIGRWAQSMQEVGVDVKGLWLLDFDSGSGYYCWRHPEPALLFFHSYDEGFRGRMPIQ